MTDSSIPWVEKYRPKNLDNISFQTNTISVIKKSLNSNNIPNMLFYGPPGIGKTSTILALANELYGNQKNINKYVLELNASNDRGIKVIREKIKNFAKKSVNTVENIPYKLVILDEADTMTKDAQTALRRCMEIYSSITRFCIICNYVSRIIEPIISRCGIFKFRSLDKASVLNTLTMVSNKEELEISEEALGTIFKISGGDLRKSITVLQSCSYFYDEITTNNIYEISAKITDEYCQQLMKKIKGKNRITSIGLDVTRDGYGIRELLNSLTEMIISSDDKSLTDTSKSNICLEFSYIEKQLVLGSSEYVQLLHILNIVRNNLVK
jgi:replication factor C subunit 2/4